MPPFSAPLRYDPEIKRLGDTHDEMSAMLMNRLEVVARNALNVQLPCRADPRSPKARAGWLPPSNAQWARDAAYIATTSGVAGKQAGRCAVHQRRRARPSASRTPHACPWPGLLPCSPAPTLPTVSAALAERPWALGGVRKRSLRGGGGSPAAQLGSRETYADIGLAADIISSRRLIVG